MNSIATPRFPLYIPSKSRAKIAMTPHVLNFMGVPWRMVVERQQLDDYAELFPRDRLLVLDPAYQYDYDTCDDAGDTKPKGSGPARNFIWDHSISEGHAWHWIMDDNIRGFRRLYQNQRTTIGDGSAFHAMETFALRYRNVGMVGPQYQGFATNRAPVKPFILNTRVFSCNLIRNDVPLRWRGRYNEDAILSVDMLKAGWCTVLFYAFLQHKEATQQRAGGNMEAFYAKEGTLLKSRMLVDLHPDVAKMAWRYGRWHHQIDFQPFKGMGLLRRPDTDDKEPVYQFTKTDKQRPYARPMK